MFRLNDLRNLEENLKENPVVQRYQGRGNEYLDKCFNEVMKIAGEATLSVFSLGLYPLGRHLYKKFSSWKNWKDVVRRQKNDLRIEARGYIVENLEALKNEYGNNYIAIRCGEIVDNSKNKPELMERVKKKSSFLHSVVGSLDDIDSLEII